MRFRAGLAIGLALMLGACATYYVPRGSGKAAGVAATAQGLSDRALARLVADMDPASLALARRHDPMGRRTDFWGRPSGWATLDIDTLPSIGFLPLDEEAARRINAVKPAVAEAIRPVPAFVLATTAAERTQALRCLTQAVYYEAGFESIEGRRAVAQTVLNRLRHPGYPKSVCGVVFEGAARATGCQFSFTCDGSLRRRPTPLLWGQAEEVARRALAGFVFSPVGTATHYHANYVLPYWAPTLLKLVQVGTHIFYRWTGPSGEPRAFGRRYAGGETRIGADILNGVDDRIQGAGLTPGAPPAPVPQRLAGVEGLVSIVTVADPTAPGGQRVEMTGSIGGRRIPTREEIARINALLAASEGKSEARPASITPAPAGP